MRKLEKLVEDICVNETVIEEGKTLKIVATFSVNGEGRGFVANDEKGKEIRLSKTCGTYMKVLI